MPKDFDLAKYSSLVVEPLVALGIHTPVAGLKYKYSDLCNYLNDLNISNYPLYLETLRDVVKEDFWFFCFYVLGLPIDHPYLISLAYELQAHADDDYLYLAAARGTWKSTLATICLSIWETCHNPKLTCLIVSYEKGMAVKQLRGIILFTRGNRLLYDLYPHIFFSPEDFRAKQVNMWSERSGVYVKRPPDFITPDPTFGAEGFIEGLPTGMHIQRLVVDDPVTVDNVATQDGIEKVQHGFRMLTGVKDKVNGCKTRVCTTRYDSDDVSKDIIESGKYYCIIRPAEVNEAGEGAFDSIPVYLTRQQLDEERENYVLDYLYACQMLQKTDLAGGNTLDPEWIRYYHERPDNLAFYIFADPAFTKSNKADYSAFVVIGVSPAKQYYLIDMVRDKLDTQERYLALRDLHKRYRPEALYYEMQNNTTDREYFEREQKADSYRFYVDRYQSNVQNNKYKRIMNLAALMRKGDFYLPDTLIYQSRNLIDELVKEEYLKFPSRRAHDDMLDALSMITQVPIRFPEPKEDTDTDKQAAQYYKNSPLYSANTGTTWMSDWCGETW